LRGGTEPNEVRAVEEEEEEIEVGGDPKGEEKAEGEGREVREEVKEMGVVGEAKRDEVVRGKLDEKTNIGVEGEGWTEGVDLAEGEGETEGESKSSRMDVMSNGLGVVFARVGAGEEDGEALDGESVGFFFIFLNKVARGPVEGVVEEVELDEGEEEKS
jgi:hypothetical protein